ncbi:MAG: class I SAM-dependent methyltransferase [Nanoarchaeota archaeon]|nr:class I SAM-dependent methyltransferase [Nanoarchaeota archaeon]
METEKIIDTIDIDEVEETSFLTLFCHAIESRSKDPIMYDKKAVAIADELSKVLTGSKKKIDRLLAAKKINKMLVTHVVIRAKKYDEYAKEFLRQNPDGTIVNIGCGMDSRFSRIDDGNVRFFDLDLPEIIELKKKFCKETERYRFVSSSVFGREWMNLVKKEKGPYFFMAEGVFMYLDPVEVRSLVLHLQKNFPGSELVCEVFNSAWLKRPWKGIVDFKLRKELHLGKDITFSFGIGDSNEMEGWNKGIEFLDDWFYLDADEKKLGMLRILRKIKLFRQSLWTVHYRLN